MKPLVSIIIPTYNRANLIAETLDSVLFQSYQNWECIIVDDGSKDQTEKVISRYLDSRFKFYKRPATKKKGASSCRNYGMEMAKGKLIQFLDDDDLLDTNKLDEQVKAYSGNNEVLTCKWGGFTDSRDLKRRFKYKYNSYRNFKKGISLLNTFGLFNEFFPLHIYLTPRELINKIGEWNEDLSNNDDAEFFTRVILEAGKVVFVPMTSVYYRYNSDNQLSAVNTNYKLNSLLESISLIEKHLKNYNSFYYKRAKENIFKYLKESGLIISPTYNNLLNDRRNYDIFPHSLLKRIYFIKSKFY